MNVNIETKITCHQLHMALKQDDQFKNFTIFT